MKTLAQIEPRKPVDATHTPGDAGNDFIISQPGSYYLTGNLRAVKPTCIRITAERVVLDLSGFELQSAAPYVGNGIVVTARECRLSGGNLTSFNMGVDAQSASGGSATGLSFHLCGTAGLHTGASWTISRCHFRENAARGLVAGDFSSVSECSARDCTGTAALHVLNSCRV